jgi:hypothetical protein
MANIREFMVWFAYVVFPDDPKLRLSKIEKSRAAKAGRSAISTTILTSTALLCLHCAVETARVRNGLCISNGELAI